MANDEERLVVALEAKINDFEKRMKQAERTGTQSFQRLQQSSQTATRKMESDMLRSTTRINQAMAQTGSNIGSFGKAFAVLGSAAALKAFQSLADSATNITNALKVAGLSGDDLTRTLNQLYAVALRNHAPIESLAQLYSRVSISQKELGISSDQLVGFTDLVGKALRVSGTSATEAAGPMLQLAQALGSGTVHAEEFNSIVEGMPALAQAAAKGIKQANGSVAELKNLVNNQQLSSRALFDGIIAGASDLDTKLHGSSTTIGQASTDLRTALTRMVGDFDTATGSAEKIAGTLEAIATGLSTIKFDNTIAGINAIISAIDTAVSKVGTLWEKLTSLATALNNGNALTDLAPPGNSEKEILDLYNQSLSAGKEQIANSEKLLDLERQRAQIIAQYGKDNPIGTRMLKSVEEQISAMQDAATKGKDELAPTVPKKPFATPHGHATPTMPAPEIEQIDINDPRYKPTGSKKTGTGKPSVPRTADDRFNADIQSIKDRTAALKEEAATIGLSYEEQTKRQTALELEQRALAEAREEARKKGQTDLDAIKLSPDKIAAIEKESAAYAAQAEKLRKVREAQEKAEQASEEFYNSFKDGLIGAIDGTNSLGDALTQIVKKLGDLFLNEAFDSLFKPATSNSSGGTFGSLFTGIGKLVTGAFADGTDYAPGGLALVGEKGPEVVNLPRGSQVIPNDHLFGGSGTGGSSAVKVDVGVTVDQNGNLKAYVKSVAQSEAKGAVGQYDSQVLPSRVNQINQDPRAR
ncbi:tape measure protein [Rhizobium rhizogenes]|uniref:tape measure protein n=1 Tax=Rhizobium rhizogenes TaxID=359 RepID=UPI001574543A|nr:tape measure protein [Rhizobium rhizogenes]NTI41609.1 tape measure protein [Rhizobium rhizogenes]